MFDKIRSRLDFDFLKTVFNYNFTLFNFFRLQFSTSNFGIDSPCRFHAPKQRITLFSSNRWCEFFLVYEFLYLVSVALATIGKAFDFKFLTFGIVPKSWKRLKGQLKIFSKKQANFLFLKVWKRSYKSSFFYSLKSRKLLQTRLDYKTPSCFDRSSFVPLRVF